MFLLLQCLLVVTTISTTESVDEYFFSKYLTIAQVNVLRIALNAVCFQNSLECPQWVHYFLWLFIHHKSWKIIVSFCFVFSHQNEVWQVPGAFTGQWHLLHTMWNPTIDRPRVHALWNTSQRETEVLCKVWKINRTNMPLWSKFKT